MKGENTIRRVTPTMQNYLKERVIFRQRKTSIERVDSLTARSLNSIFP